MNIHKFLELITVLHCLITYVLYEIILLLHIWGYCTSKNNSSNIIYYLQDTWEKWDWNDSGIRKEGAWMRPLGYEKSIVAKVTRGRGEFKKILRKIRQDVTQILTSK